MIKSFQKAESPNSKVLILGMIIILSIVYGYHLFDLKGTFLYNDEMGYWTHAGTLLGWNWKSALPEIFPWYSYGYSLVLLPILAISGSLTMAYQIAIVLNIVFAITSFYLSFIIFKKITSLSDLKLLLLCFLSALYPSIIFQAKIAWSETFLMLMIWVGIYFLFKYIESHQALYCFISSATFFFCYIIHNRALAVIGAYIFLILELACFDKIPKKHLWMVFISIGIFFILNIYIKNFFEYNEMSYYAYQYASDNGVSGVTDRFMQIFSIKGICKFILGFIGKLWYFITSTFFIAFFSFFILVKFQFFYLKNLLLKKELSNKDILYNFIFLTTFFMMIISTVFMIDLYGPSPENRIRIDPLFYGRYNECLIGLILMVGLLYLVEELNNKKYLMKIFLLGILLYTISSIVLEKFLEIIGAGFSGFTINPPTAVAILFYQYIFSEFSFLKCSILTLTISILLFLILYYLVSITFLKMSFIALSFVFILTSEKAGIVYTLKNQALSYSFEKVQIYEYLKQSSSDIYIYGNQISTIPLWCMDKKVGRIVDIHKLEPLQEDDIVVTPGQNRDELLLSGHFKQIHEGVGEDILQYKADKYYDLAPSTETDNLIVMSDSVLFEDNWVSDYLKLICNLPKENLTCKIKFSNGIPFENLDFSEIPIEIKINGKVIETILLNETVGREMIFQIREDSLIDGANIFEFIPLRTWSPSDYGSPDNRILSFSMAGLQFMVQDEK